MSDLALRSSHAVLAAMLVAASTSACSTGDDDDAAAPCSTLAPDQIVPASFEFDGAPPPATGGLVSEGTYRLTALTVYMTSSTLVLPKCSALADTLVLSDGGFEHAVGCYFEADNPETRTGGGAYQGSYSTSDTAFVFNQACPAALLETFPYSAEPTTLRMSITDTTGSLTTELVWTLE